MSTARAEKRMIDREKKNGIHHYTHGLMFKQKKSLEQVRSRAHEFKSNKTPPVHRLSLNRFPFKRLHFLSSDFIITVFEKISSILVWHRMKWRHSCFGWKFRHTKLNDSKRGGGVQRRCKQELGWNLCNEDIIRELDISIAGKYFCVTWVTLNRDQW